MAIIYMELPEEEGINLLRYLTKAKQQNNLVNAINLILADYLRKVLTDDDYKAMEKARQEKTKAMLKEQKDNRESAKPDWDLSKDKSIPDAIPSPGMTEKQLDIIKNDKSENALDIFSFR